MSIYKYYLADSPDSKTWEGRTYNDPRVANEAAKLHNKAVIEVRYEFADSELVVDYSKVEADTTTDQDD